MKMELFYTDEYTLRNDPNPKLLKIPATMMNGARVGVMVAFDNRNIMVSDAHNDLTKPFTRALFDAAKAIVCCVNPYDVQTSKDTAATLVFCGKLHGKEFNVFVTPPYCGCESNRCQLYDDLPF